MLPVSTASVDLDMILTTAMSESWCVTLPRSTRKQRNVCSEGKGTRSCLEVLGDSPIKYCDRKKGWLGARVVAHSTPLPTLSTDALSVVGREGGYTTSAQETAMP